MDLGVISVRYARALLKSALRLKQDATVYEEMQSLSESFLQLPQLRQTITNPMLDNKNKLSLLETACGGTPSELTSSFLYHPLSPTEEYHLRKTYHSGFCFG